MTVEVADVPGAIWVSFAVDHRAFATVASVDREFRLCQSRLAWKCQRKVRDKVSGKVKVKGQTHDYDLGIMLTYAGYWSYLGFHFYKFKKLGVQNARNLLLYRSSLTVRP